MDRNVMRELTAVRVAATPYKHQGRHDSDIAAHTGLTVTRAWALALAAIDRDDVVAVLPAECGRLRRLRERRRRARGARY